MSDKRLDKFLADTQEAVRMARETPEVDKVRSEALYTAISVARVNCEATSSTVSMDEIISMAKKVEPYLRGDPA